jgi:hypothetical protein
MASVESGSLAAVAPVPGQEIIKQEVSVAAESFN